MSRMTELLKELETESATTRRVLERVPEASLGWKPHEKSMTLGVLAMHIAEAPGNIAKMISCDTYVIPDDHVARAASSRSELLEAFETSLAEAKRILAGFDDMRLATTWTIMRGGQVVTSMSRGAGLRFVMMNHVYHHRGQLSVYLRLLNVPVPSIYGPSADENPRAAS